MKKVNELQKTCSHSNDGWCFECVDKLYKTFIHDLNNAHQIAITALDALAIEKKKRLEIE